MSNAPQDYRRVSSSITTPESALTRAITALETALYSAKHAIAELRAAERLLSQNPTAREQDILESPDNHVDRSLPAGILFLNEK